MRPCWKQRKSLLLNVEYMPCNCMLMMEHRQELLIGCGNTVRVLSLTDLLLDPEEFVVAPVNQDVQGMAHYGDMVWCFVRDSCYIAQYDIAKRQLVDRFHCSGIFKKKGQCLSNSISPSDRDDSASPIPIPALPTSPSTNTVCENGPFRRQQVSTTSSRPKSVEASIMRKRFAIDRTRSQSTGSRDSLKAQYVNVTSLLTVKDTLWIGRTNGDILVIGVNSECATYKFGEVLHVLCPDEMLEIPNGPVSKLFRVGSDTVVACRDVASANAPMTIQERPMEQTASNNTTTAKILVYNLKPSPYKYQFLVWESWGSEELRQFGRLHEVLHK